MKNQRGFTFIELLITLSVLSVAILPLMHMFASALDQVNHTGEAATARYLAQETMEMTRNLGFTTEQLKALGDVWDPPRSSPARLINGHSWRVLRAVNPKSEPLEVVVKVYKEEHLRLEGPQTKPVVELITLFEDFDWSITQ